MREVNIFHNIITNENSCTELFCNLLADKIFRNTFLSRFLSKKQLDTLSYNNIETQLGLQGDEKGRPDINISNENIELYIEIKIDNAPLTNNQPSSYLSALSAKSCVSKTLLFILPPDYIHLNELNKRITAFFDKYPKIQIETHVIQWGEIINIIKSNKILMKREHYVSFMNLLRAWYEIKLINFSKEEVKAMYEKELLKLFHIVETVKDYNSKKCNPRISAGKKEYGCYFKDAKGDTILYFGVWYPFWKKFNKPFCYGVSLKSTERKIVDKFTKAHKDYCLDYENWRMAWIDEDIYLEHKCSETIAKVIEKELNHLIELK